MSESEDVQVTPRLCHLVKWPDFEGYGFNLHAEKSRPGQFVGAVDPGSPAEAAGLRPGDRIVEVNGVNVSHENHRQVVERIKAVESETRLLVLDTDADRLCREKKIVVKSTMPNVLVIKTPVTRDPPEYLNVEPPQPQQNGKTNGEEAPPVAANGKHVEKAPPVAANGKHEEKVPEEKPSPPPAPKLDTPSPTITKTKEELPLTTSRSSTPSIPDSPRSTKSSNSSSGGGVASNGGPALSVSTPPGGLNLNMSASEMRQMLANRRKKDPKKENMDIRQKYDIIQQM